MTAPSFSVVFETVFKIFVSIGLVSVLIAMGVGVAALVVLAAQ